MPYVKLGMAKGDLTTLTMKRMRALKREAAPGILDASSHRRLREKGLNDVEIRKSFHEKKLRRYHEAPDTLVVDELGLRHGACRADIAVINGRLLGYEIKSDSDRLTRLPAQIPVYNAVFDRIAIIAGARHISEVRRVVPGWWGIILSQRSVRGGVRFITERRSSTNPEIDLLSVAKLLWRSEAIQILREKGEEGKTLAAPRRVLYARLVKALPGDELRSKVRLFLRGRTNWRCRPQLSQCDDLSRPIAR